MEERRGPRPRASPAMSVCAKSLAIFSENGIGLRKFSVAGIDRHVSRKKKRPASSGAPSMQQKATARYLPSTSPNASNFLPSNLASCTASIGK
jgi:hypothetical protein